jgi:hypothetical protein
MLAWTLPIVTVLAFLLALGSSLRAKAALRRADKKLRDWLSRERLQVRGDPTRPEAGLALARADGVTVKTPDDLPLGATTPLTQPALYRGSVVRGPLALPSLVVCERTAAQAVFGPFPPAPQPTGSAAFDARFGVYPAVDSREPSTYRDDAAKLVAWASPTVLASLHALDFRGLRVADGQAELGFGPLSVDGLVSAVRVLDDLDAAARGRPARARPAPAGAMPANFGVLVWLLLPALALTVLLTEVSTSMTFQDADRDASLTFGANTAACPEGGRYSAGPGYRKQHRTHYCYQPNGTKTAAAATSYSGWLFSATVFGGAAVLLHAGARRTSRRATLLADGIARLGASG